MAVLLAVMLACVGCAAQQTAELEDDEVAMAGSTSQYLSGTFVDAGGLKVKGGTQGTDWQLDGKILHVKSSTQLVIKSDAQTDTTIDIDAGVKADVVLAGVNINSAARAPINVVTNSSNTADGQKAKFADDIRNKTTLHLTLADGTENYLRNSDTNSNASTGWPGLRCGWGSILIIDDEETNVVSGGSKFNLADIVTPENGLVPRNLTLLSGKQVSAGDPLSKMESANPGSLYVNGGTVSAGIGGGYYENSGTLVFNGGNVDSKVYEGQNSPTHNAFSGSGIGGGVYGSGTVLTFNGGNVRAEGGWCGTAIGSGFGFHIQYTADGNSPSDAISTKNAFSSFEAARGWTFNATAAAPYNNYTGTKCGITGTNAYHAVAGDITINGGFVNAVASRHGNAIGQACGHGVSTNREHIIRITGGTVVAKVFNPGQRDPFQFGIGAALGYTIVTGGSINVEKGTSPEFNGVPLFQGIGDTAYNTQGIATWADVTKKLTETNATKLPDADKVFMVQIDLTADLNAAGVDLNSRITDWDLKVGGVSYDYGAPQRFDNGKLFLWLPSSATSQNIAVNLSYPDKDGNPKALDPLFKEPGGTDTLLRRYVSFELDKAYLATLNKTYDGKPMAAYDLVAHPVTTKEASGSERVLNLGGDIVSLAYQRYTGVDGVPLDKEYTPTDVNAGDAGIIKFTLVSRQYSSADPNGWGKSYWGHRAIGWAEIKNAESQVTNLDAEWVEANKKAALGDTADKHLRVSADIKAGAKEAASCQYPQGSVQLYVDGKPAGNPLAMKFQDGTVTIGAPTSTASTGAGDDAGMSGQSLDLESMGLMSEGLDLLGDAGTTVTAPPNANTAVAAPANTVIPTAANATIVPAGEGSYTHFTYDFKPADILRLAPTATDDGTHIVSLKFLPLKNYNESISPDPDKADDETIWAKVKIDPVDPEPEAQQVTKPGPRKLQPGEEGYDPENPDKTVPVEVDPDTPYSDEGTQVKIDPTPTKDPTDKTTTLKGEIKTKFSEPTEDNPYPGRVVLKLDTPSGGDITVTGADGTVIKAEVLKDENGDPIRDEDGKITLVVDPTGVGLSSLVVSQEGTWAHNPVSFEFAVEVAPDYTITPVPATAKSVKNLTNPEGPTREGDKLEYTITLSNSAAKSIWKDVVAVDAVPAALAVDEDSISIENVAGDVNATAVKASGADPAAGEYTLGSDNGLKVGVGNVYGPNSATVTFTATVKAGSAGEDITNIAEATGKKAANPDDPSSSDSPLPSEPSDPAAPEGGSTVDKPVADGEKTSVTQKFSVPVDPTAPPVRPDDIRTKIEQILGDWLPTGTPQIVITDADGNRVHEIDRSKPGVYEVVLTYIGEDGTIKEVVVTYEVSADQPEKLIEDVNKPVDPNGDPWTKDDIIKDINDRHPGAIPDDATNVQVSIIGPDGQPVDKIDPSVPGTYEVTITYTDAEGNTQTIKTTYTFFDDADADKLSGQTDPEGPDGGNNNNAPAGTAADNNGPQSGQKGFSDIANRVLAQTGDPVVASVIVILTAAVVCSVVLLFARRNQRKSQ